MSSSSGFCSFRCFPNADSNSYLSPFTFSPHSFIVAFKFLNRSLRPLQVSIAAASSFSDTSGSNQRVKGSGTSARSRRLLRIREEKRQREHDRVHNYPAWAKVLEYACKDNMEVRAVLGDYIGNPKLMRKWLLSEYHILHGTKFMMTMSSFIHHRSMNNVVMDAIPQTPFQEEYSSKTTYYIRS